MVLADLANVTPSVTVVRCGPLTKEQALACLGKASGNSCVVHSTFAKDPYYNPHLGGLMAASQSVCICTCEHVCT